MAEAQSRRGKDEMASEGEAGSLRSHKPGKELLEV